MYEMQQVGFRCSKLVCEPLRLVPKIEEVVYKVMRNTFSNYKGSPVFSTRVAVGPTRVIIWHTYVTCHEVSYVLLKAQPLSQAIRAASQWYLH